MSNTESSVYQSTPWPLVILNVLMLVILSGFCLLFEWITRTLTPEHFRSQLFVDPMLMPILSGYLIGIGLLIGLGASYLAWISGPEVYLADNTLSVKATWLVDKTFPRRREFSMPLAEIAKVKRIRFLTMPYLQLTSTKKNIYLPLFLFNKKQLFNQLNQSIDESHPLKPFL